MTKTQRQLYTQFYNEQLNLMTVNDEATEFSYNHYNFLAWKDIYSGKLTISEHDSIISDEINSVDDFINFLEFYD